jgi:hypothetical protein
MLRSTLGDTRYELLCAVARRVDPGSGRALAGELKLSPTTASERLRGLEEAGFVRSTQAGKAKLWRLNTDNDVIRAWLLEQRSPRAGQAPGASPIATGGGGVTFERKVAADYLAKLLLGHGAPGLRPGRAVTSVRFQAAPEFSVDDLVVGASENSEAQPSVMLAVAARRTPNIVKSDDKSKALFRSFVKQLMDHPADGPDLRLALAAADTQGHVTQLKTLARYAADQPGAEEFAKLVKTPKKFDREVVTRWGQIEGLVRSALVDLGLAAPSSEIVQRFAWRMLSRLTVLTPRLEEPDDSDWAALANTLIPIARGTDLYGATQLRDRLLTLADDYAPAAAQVTLSSLRRDAHDLVDSAARRHREGWRLLRDLDGQARSSVRSEITTGDGGRRFQVARTDVMLRLQAAVSTAGMVVVTGESGVGKSAVVMAQFPPDVPGPVSADAAEWQVACVNLRQLPSSAVELEHMLAAPLHDLLAEMSAPNRVLVVDGADAAAETSHDMLAHLARAAAAAEVKLVAVTSEDVKQSVLDTITGGSSAVPEVVVSPLSDEQVDQVVAAFGELEPMAANVQSRELLRRPVVIDLLVRGGVQGLPVSDFDAMQQVWTRLVLRRGPNGRGTPLAREAAMLLLARLALHGGNALDVVSTVNADALDGLQRDGLLRAPVDGVFRVGPEFAHDELRRYAVARLLLAEEAPDKALLDAGVPRWALGAARLACQGMLSAAGTGSNPLPGRLARWQAAFDQLAAAGHGERWTDVPGEALLTLADPSPVLRDAWPALQYDDSAGFRRLVRLVEQRLRDRSTFVRVRSVEPLIELLLQEEAPWRSSEGARTLLRDWAQALVVADMQAGHPLREVLRSRLLEFCVGADERLRQQRAARDAEREALPAGRGVSRSIGIGYPRRLPRRRDPEISSEIADDTILELFALLGPDLGADGEAVLRRVAEAAPQRLYAALEGPICGRALAGWRRGLLADLTLAYYLDDSEEAASYRHDFGVRGHRGYSFGTPLAAWYRGPFMPLLQSDFRGGVSVLNKVLTHAARARTDRGAELGVTGVQREYAGDEHVWQWYRGTGVGPYPCMSALQALELVCDRLVLQGMALETLLPIVLDGCDNLAMVALAWGLLVRHLDKAGRLPDWFLAEPDVWHLEFNRIVHEHSGLRASSEHIIAPERRLWSPREVAAALILAADPDRATELRLVGQRLVDNARRSVEQLPDDVAAEDIERELSTVRAWAAGLDRDAYSMQPTDDGILIETQLPADVAAALQEGQHTITRSQETARLLVRYHIEPQKGTGEPFTTDNVVADLSVAHGLLDPRIEPGTMEWDSAAAVAALALAQHLLHDLALPDESIRQAVEILLRVAEGEPAKHPYENPESYFMQGADRSAATALPLLLMPAARHVRRLVGGDDGAGILRRAGAAAAALSRAVPHETRLFLARGLDPVWTTSCASEGECAHRVAFDVAVSTMRDCVLGPWNSELQERTIEELADPVANTLLQVADDSIYLPRLDPAMRCLAPAAVSSICVSGEARSVLDALIDTHRRALLAAEPNVDHRGTHALAVARALLTLDEDVAIYAHLDACMSDPDLTRNALRALSMAAEESPVRAVTVRRIWPALVERVLAAHDAGDVRLHGGFDSPLGVLLPNTAGETTYLHTEPTSIAHAWWDPLTLTSTVERWLRLAHGEPDCVDQLVGFLAPLPLPEQARVGLQWIAAAVLADPPAVAGRTYLLTRWLIDTRAHASELGLGPVWQRVVDALVVAGQSRLAPYSE